MIDWSIVLSFASISVPVVLAMVYGYNKQRAHTTAKFDELKETIGGIDKRLGTIETRLEVEQKYRDEREAIMEQRVRGIFMHYCQNECPHKRSVTNPKIQVYPQE